MSDLVGGSVQLEWDLQRSPFNRDRQPTPLAIFFLPGFEYRQVQVLISEFVYYCTTIAPVPVSMGCGICQGITGGKTTPGSI